MNTERTGESTADAAESNIAKGRAPGIVAAVAVLVLAGLTIVGSIDLVYWQNGPGPGFFPLWLGVLLAGLSVLWMAQVALGRNVHVAEPIPPGGRLAVVQVLVGLFITILVLNLIGFQLAMTIFVFYVVLIVGKRRLIEAIIAGLVSGFGVYSLFANVLQVFLPAASVGFLSQLGL